MGRHRAPCTRTRSGSRARIAHTAPGRSRGLGCRTPGNGGTRARRGRVPGHRRHHARRRARARSRSASVRCGTAGSARSAPPVGRRAVVRLRAPTPYHAGPRRPLHRACGASWRARSGPRYRTKGVSIPRQSRGAGHVARRHDHLRRAPRVPRAQHPGLGRDRRETRRWQADRAVPVHADGSLAQAVASRAVPQLLRGCIIPRGGGSGENSTRIAACERGS